MKNTDVKELSIKGRHVLTYVIVNNVIHVEIKHPDMNITTALRFINRVEKTTIKKYINKKW